jgi:prolyl 4-hydroxylase
MMRAAVAACLLLILLLCLMLLARSRASCCGALRLSLAGAAPELILLHADPCVRLVEGLLAPHECQHLIDTYRGGLARSTVAGEREEQHASRTSSTVFLPAGDKDAVIAVAEERIVLLTGVPLPNWETLQLTHYSAGQQYQPHVDWFDESPNNRSMTVFVYLNDVPEEDGGATEFTKLNLRVQPKRGRALVWFNCQASSEGLLCDARTEHAGRPPARGEKFGLNGWARTSRFR